MQDKIIAKDKWEFNKEVTDCFDDMLNRSIPEIENMRDLTEKIGRHFIKSNTEIIDLGCSTGLAIYPFIKDRKAKTKFRLFDVSDAMLEKCRENYKEEIKEGFVSVEKFDIRNGLDETSCASLILCVLTLQFTPIEYRQKIVKSIYDTLAKGCALILVEKVLGYNYKIDKIFVDEYYNKKRENAYTNEQIEAKRKSLEGVLVPITAKWNEELLKSAGFSEIDCFWRFLNFCGWIAIK